MKPQYRIIEKWEMGLSYNRGALVWVMHGGWGLWLPPWLRHFIIYGWNRIHCALYGHDPVDKAIWAAFPGDRYGSPKCVNCGAQLGPDGWQRTEMEPETDDWEINPYVTCPVCLGVNTAPIIEAGKKALWCYTCIKITNVFPAEGL